MALLATTKIDGENYEIHLVEDHELGEVVSMFLNAMAKGDGLSRNEFESEESLLEYLNHGPVMVLKKESDENVLGVFTIRKSPLVRSENSMYNAGYMILKAEMRKKGVATTLVKRNHIRVRDRYGFVATVARTATISKAVGMITRNHWTILGTIPNSMYFPQFGWVDDLVCYSSTDADNEAEYPVFEDPKSIPPRGTPDFKFLLNEDRLKKVALPLLEFKNQNLLVDFASHDDVIPVEEMIREAAFEGVGFAADEFTSNGYINRRLLLRSHMIVVKSEDGQIRAGLVFGPTAICREKTTFQVGGYMIIRKSDRGQGLGNCLLEYCLKNMERMGYSAILTDVFACNLPTLKMLQKRAFMATATVPNSGFINGQGRTHAYLMYKQRKNVKQSML